MRAFVPGSPGTRLIYRPEIDGLRALAVVPVILFHAGFASFGGGYVGVDVFYVISGYLITSILLEEMEGGTYSLVRFYERRVRRILPALFLVMAACIPVAWYWLVPQDLEAFGKSLVAVATFSSNVLFWRESNYFDTSSELKPLLHTWSLAVEEQYYILFPLFLGYSRRWGARGAVVAIATLALASLAMAQWGAYHRPAAAFFLLPTRGWEILLGALAALRLRAHGPWPLRRDARAALALLGIAMVAAAVLCFRSNTPTPSVYTLLPTVGTVLLILCAQDGNLVQRALRQRGLVGVGLVSYSAYLWHQPLFAFARRLSVEPPGAGLMIGLTLVTFVLAFLSWRWVERLFRQKGSIARGPLFAGASVMAAGFVAAGLAASVTGGFPERHSLAGVVVHVRGIRDAYCYNAGRRTAAQLAAGDFCAHGPAPRNIVVLGDSHAGALMDELGARLAAEGRGVATASWPFCPPVFDFELPEHNDHCAKGMDAALKRVIADPALKTVILVAQWSNYTTGRREPDPPVVARRGDVNAKDASGDRVLFEAAFRETVAALRAAGKRLIIVGPLPEFPAEVIPEIEKHRLLKLPDDPPRVSVKAFRERNHEFFEILADLPGLEVVDMQPLFCGSQWCTAEEGALVLFSDRNHLTEYGARIVAERLMRQVDGAAAR